MPHQPCCTESEAPLCEQTPQSNIFCMTFCNRHMQTANAPWHTGESSIWQQTASVSVATCRLWAFCQLHFLHFTLQLIKLSGRLYTHSPLTPFNSHHSPCLTHSNTALCLNVWGRKSSKKSSISAISSNSKLWLSEQRVSVWFHKCGDTKKLKSFSSTKKRETNRKKPCEVSCWALAVASPANAIYFLLADVVL